MSQNSVIMQYNKVTQFFTTQQLFQVWAKEIAAAGTGGTPGRQNIDTSSN